MIEGAVITFSDITALKAVEAEAGSARDYAQSIVDTVREPLLVLNGRFEVVSASKAFYKKFGVTPKRHRERCCMNSGTTSGTFPLRELLETVLPKDTEL